MDEAYNKVGPLDTAHSGLGPWTAGQAVRTKIVSKNALLCAGLSHFLKGSHFVIDEQRFDGTADLVAAVPAVHTLILVDGGLEWAQVQQTITRIRAQQADARVVVIAELLERSFVDQAFAMNA